MITSNLNNQFAFLFYNKIYLDFYMNDDMLVEMLKGFELQPLPGAHVLVMKFKLRGISIDFIYANISLWVVP